MHHLSSPQCREGRVKIADGLSNTADRVRKLCTHRQSLSLSVGAARGEKVAIGQTRRYMYPSRRSVSSPPPSAASCARPERSAMFANLPVRSSSTISDTVRAVESTAFVHGSQPRDRYRVPRPVVSKYRSTVGILSYSMYSQMFNSVQSRSG